ncbi:MULTISPECIES: hypothetical protein [unclassified Pseudoxanthomonas]|uniref:hypothetical protein n=1 Tax=unclassified Pseudoxanthomonas TaxID=2645906 RepID=UPI00307E8F58
MEKCAEKFVLLVVSALMLGCSPESNRSLDPVVIADEFAKSPTSASVDYRKKWDGNQLTELDRTTLAGELLRADSPRGAEYLAQIRASARSDDPEIAAAAANSLRNANDDESLDMLEELSASHKPQVARAAAHSFGYKRQEIVGGELTGPDATRVELRLGRICSRSPLVGYVRELVCD